MRIYRALKAQPKKYIKLYLFAITLILNLNILIAQGDSTSKYSIQFDYGIAATLHYNQPVNLSLCFEGCFAEKQKSRFASNLNLSFYRTFKKKNNIKIGIGYSEYRFWEKGFASSGGVEFFPYELIRELKYLNFSIGFKRNLTLKKKINPFIETEFIVEYLSDDDYFLNNHGFANKTQIGASINTPGKWSFMLGAFFKTGIIKYNERKFNENYVPFGYGIQVGLNMKI